jgi:hypothetical protein
VVRIASVVPIPNLVVVHRLRRRFLGQSCGASKQNSSPKFKLIAEQGKQRASRQNSSPKFNLIAEQGKQRASKENSSTKVRNCMRLTMIFPIGFLDWHFDLQVTQESRTGFTTQWEIDIFDACG